MNHEAQTQSLSGRVTDVFAHRFVVEAVKGKVLADLGPKGAERVSRKEGDRGELIGDMKPWELKVHSIARNGGRPVLVGHPGKPRSHPREFEEADAKPALKTVEARASPSWAVRAAS